MRIFILTMFTAALALAQKQPPAVEAQLKLELDGMKKEEKASQARLEDLIQKYSKEHPEVKSAQRKLESVRERQDELLQLLGGPVMPGDRLAPTRKPGRVERWWRDPLMAQSLGLTADQQQRMDGVFQQSRLKLIDLNAALEKEEVTLEPLVSAEPFDEARAAAQIDRVAQARAELERANGRMLLGLRKILSLEQWTKLSQSKRLR